MPNHVINILNIDGDKDKVAKMLSGIQNDEYGIGSIDFEKIIPMPESLRIEAGSSTTRGLKAYKDFVSVYTFAGANADKDLCDIPEEKEKVFLNMRTDIRAEDWELGRQAFRNELQYGAPTWYEWSIKNWGTKWNAYGLDTYENEVTDSNPTLSFQTAWSAPHPILAKLAEMYPEVSFEHTWADEDIGQNCGQATYANGECTGRYYPEGSEAIIFANSVWGYDDIDEGMGEQNL